MPLLYFTYQLLPASQPAKKNNKLYLQTSSAGYILYGVAWTYFFFTTFHKSDLYSNDIDFV